MSGFGVGPRSNTESEAKPSFNSKQWHRGSDSLTVRFRRQSGLQACKSCCFANESINKRRGFIQVFHGVRKRNTLQMDKLISVCTVRGGEEQRICCASSWKWKKDSMWGDVTGHFIVARALNDRQCKALLDEVGGNYPGLLLHSSVLWLSRGKVLSYFAACLSETRTFLEMKDIKHPELANTEWLLKF